MRMYWDPPSDDEPAGDTRFHRILRWQVHNPADAMDCAWGHHWRAAEARSCIPQVIEDYRDRPQANGLEDLALRHEKIAAVCERHAARLQAEAEADQRTREGGH